MLTICVHILTASYSTQSYSILSQHIYSTTCTPPRCLFIFFFFNDTATTEIYTLSLHDALPISRAAPVPRASVPRGDGARAAVAHRQDRKSTRLNSSHSQISYAVFCLKKKKKKKNQFPLSLYTSNISIS